MDSRRAEIRVVERCKAIAKCRSPMARTWRHGARRSGRPDQRQASSIAYGAKEEEALIVGGRMQLGQGSGYWFLRRGSIPEGEKEVRYSDSSVGGRQRRFALVFRVEVRGWKQDRGPCYRIAR